MSASTFTSERRGALGAFAAAAALGLVPALARAQPAPAAACQAVDSSLPPALGAWAAKVPASSAVSPAGLAAASLQVGQAAQVTLHGTREVDYPVQPAKPGGSVAYGGLLQFAVDAPGTYRVALSSGAWIDVVEGGTAVASTAHGHGPDCTSVRKMVDYPLQAGVHLLQVSANASPQIGVLVIRLP